MVNWTRVLNLQSGKYVHPDAIEPLVHHLGSPLGIEVRVLSLQTMEAAKQGLRFAGLDVQDDRLNHFTPSCLKLIGGNYSAEQLRALYDCSLGFKDDVFDSNRQPISPIVRLDMIQWLGPGYHVVFTPHSLTGAVGTKHGRLKGVLEGIASEYMAPRSSFEYSSILDSVERT